MEKLQKEMQKLLPEDKVLQKETVGKEAKQKSRPSSFLEEISTLVMSIFVLADIYLLVVAINGLFYYCDKPLQLWR